MIPAMIATAVAPETITKVTRLFNNTAYDVICELFQNARRAGAIQEAVASGSARKKDLGVVGGGLLLGLGVGALGGTYGSTDIGKITSLAMLDAYRKLIADAQPRLQARLKTPPQASPVPGGVATAPAASIVSAAPGK